jgi:hypothetical protein
MARVARLSRAGLPGRPKIVDAISAAADSCRLPLSSVDGSPDSTQDATQEIRVAGGAGHRQPEADLEGHVLHPILLQSNGSFKNPETEKGGKSILPSAMGYAERIEAYNRVEAGSVSLLEPPLVWCHEGDLYVGLRFEGRFACRMQLSSFPMDVQTLRMTFVLWCATGGSEKGTFCKSENFEGRFDQEGFWPTGSWHPLTEQQGAQPPQPQTPRQAPNSDTLN